MWIPSFVALLAGLSLTAQTSTGHSRPEPNTFNLEKEAALGRQLAAEYSRGNTPIESGVAQEYVDRLGERLATQMTEAKFPFVFKTVAGGTCMEPVGLPGGYVFISAQLLLAADEAQFAGALAHAMEHVAQRHGTFEASRPAGAANTTIPLVFIGGWSGSCSAGSASPAAFSAPRRQYEIDADALAAEALAHAGLDPRGLLRFIEQFPQPDRDQRLTNLRAALELLPRNDRSASPSDDFIAAQKEVRALTEPPVRPKHRPTLMR